MDSIIAWLQDIVSWIQCIPLSIKCYIVAFANYLKDLLLYIPHQIFALFCLDLVSFLSIIPVPSFINDAHTYMQSAYNYVGFWFNILNLGTGFMIIISSMVLKFLIRRIPFVG